MKGRLWRRGAAAVLASVLVAGVIVGAGTLSAAAAGNPPRERVGRAPRHPARSRVVGALPGTAQLQLTVLLKPSDPAGLADYAAGVSTPGSPLYHHYLTVREFRRRFGPTDAAVRVVRASLSAQGLQPGPVSANGMAVSLSASSGTIAKAFSLSFQQVQLPSGRTAFANTQPPQLSTSVAGDVQSVVGLDNLAEAHPVALTPSKTPRFRAHAAAQVATGGPQPCSAASSVSGAYTADQLASAYRVSGLYGAGDQGAGQTVALVEFEPNSETDIAAYQSCYGTSASVTTKRVDGGAGSGSGSGEAALDIEGVIGLAPKASVLVYQAPKNSGVQQVLDTYTAMISDNAAQVISTSWGVCEPDLQPNVATSENQLFQEAAVQGQSTFAASGDSGSEDCIGDPVGGTQLAVDDPASQPFVTGVGGTSVSALGPPPTETVWNDFCSNLACGGGGGISTLWPMASYQSGAPGSLNVVSSASSGTPCGAATGYCREVPDVSADADPSTGYAIRYRGAWTAIGGTSASAPLWAALAALTNASSACTGETIGFANPMLYQVAAGHPADFNDVTSGNNDITGSNGGKFAAGPRYDMATGLGTPNGSALAQALCGAADPVAVTSPGNQSTLVGTPVSLAIAASDARGQSLSYTATGVPAGLSLDPSTGTLSGTPTTVGSSTVTITATDTGHARASTTFVWIITARSTSTTLGCAPSNLVTGATTTCTATVSDTASGGTRSTPAGTISWSAAPANAGSFPGGPTCTLAPTGTTGTGTCQATFTPSAPGTPTLTATYAGDSLHSGSTSSGFALTVPAAPQASIKSPTTGGAYDLGQSVTTTFACTEAAGGPGIATCADSSGASPPGGALDTSGYGPHTYTVTATSQDGLIGTASIGYWVAQPPTATVTAPVVGGTYEMGQVVATSFSCTEGQGGPGISACSDSNNGSSPNGLLDTTTPGSHTYTVTATSGDGRSSTTAPLSYTVIAPPTATIASPAGGGVYSLGDQVATTFSCAEGRGGPGVAKCSDSNNGSSPHGSLDTSTYGRHAYTVTATSNDSYTGTAAIGYWVDEPPTAAISSPASGGIYGLGTTVPTSFGCADGPGGSGLSSCIDSHGAGPGGGALDTSHLGPHTYTVTARTNDGLSASTQITYTVAPMPNATIAAPAAGGTYALNQPVPTEFSCTDGAGGPGIAACTDSHGGTLDTSTYGRHTYTVTAKSNDGASSTASIDYTVAAPPVATISSPASGGTYTLGQPVSARFSCAEGLDGPGVASCTDSRGSHGPSNALDTSSYGRHNYTVTAVSRDGQSGAASIAYTVVPPPVPRETTRPVVTGGAKAGQALACSPGAWTNGPTSFAYQWTRNGTSLVGATARTYKVRPIDEGTTLRCSVIATNAGGPGRPAGSQSVRVATPAILGCPAATGRASGPAFGLIKLGMTRPGAQRAYRRSTAHHAANQDVFCLTPAGIHVGYPSPQLLRTLAPNVRAALAGRVIWTFTANPYYAVGAVRPGAVLATAQRALPRGTLVAAGAARWYVARAGSVTALIELRGGVVQEVGIADPRVASSARARTALLRALSA